MKTKFVLLFFLLSNLISFSQNDIDAYNPVSFNFIKYDGSIGNYQITVFLTFNIDKSIEGYYYYNNVGKFIKIIMKPYEKCFKVIAFEDHLSSNSQNETFTVTEDLYLNKTSINGIWQKEDKKLKFSLVEVTNNFNWKFLSINSIGYYSNEYFHTQKSSTSFIYPNSNVFNSLNRTIMSIFFNYEENKKLIDYINSNDTKYLEINKNYGINPKNLDIGLWSNDTKGEIIFFNDSILTYKTSNYTYGNHGDHGESIFSIRITDGKILKATDIIKENSIDSVLFILNNKYKEVISENRDDNFQLSYNKNSEVYLSPKGIYFRERYFRLAPYVDLYLSFKEINTYLTDEFKKLINCP